MSTQALKKMIVKFEKTWELDVAEEEEGSGFLLKKSHLIWSKESSISNILRQVLERYHVICISCNLL